LGNVQEQPPDPSYRLSPRFSDFSGPFERMTDWSVPEKFFFIPAWLRALPPCLFAIFARDYYSGLLLRGLMGLAVGGVYTPGLKLISENFTSSMRGRPWTFSGAGSLGLGRLGNLTGWIGGQPRMGSCFVITALGPVLGASFPISSLGVYRIKKRRPRKEDSRRTSIQ